MLISFNIKEIEYVFFYIHKSWSIDFFNHTNTFVKCVLSIKNKNMTKLYAFAVFRICSKLSILCILIMLSFRHLFMGRIGLSPNTLFWFKHLILKYVSPIICFDGC